MVRERLLAVAEPALGVVVAAEEEGEDEEEEEGDDCVAGGHAGLGVC
jgi:hypothetical protein